MGKTVRKEDEITTNEELQYKIYDLYKEQGRGDTLDVSSLTGAIKCDDFSYLFSGYENVKYIIGLEDWDVSKVINMYHMFRGCKKFNCDLSKWNVSKVENMEGMFKECKKFNSDLSKWNVSSVGDMNEMFEGCEKFNSDLSNWDVSNVEDMEGMFDRCDSLKNKPSWYKNEGLNESIWSDMQDRSMGKTVREEDKITTNEELKNKIQELYKEQGEGETLDVSSLTNIIKCDDFSGIFEGYKKVKHIIGLENWDVSKVTNMKEMFSGCIHFNSDLSKWDVSSVGDMDSMFWYCKQFNSDLSKWNVSNVTYMGDVFEGCEIFNSDLSNWDVSSVRNMYGMFDGCKSLKPIPSWYYTHS